MEEPADDWNLKAKPQNEQAEPGEEVQTQEHCSYSNGLLGISA
jgi:hypothetical protein